MTTASAADALALLKREDRSGHGLRVELDDETTDWGSGSGVGKVAVTTKSGD